MYTVTHVLTALIICLLLKDKFPQQSLFLFALGSFLPDVDHLYMHRFLLHNIFFLLASLTASRILLKSLALPLGVLLHFLEDMLASNFNTLLYPITVIDLDLELWWLYSAWFNIVITLLFASLLILKEKIILERRNLQDNIRFTLMMLASLSFGTPKASEILLGYVSPILVEAARFASVTILLTAYFKPYQRDKST